MPSLQLLKEVESVLGGVGAVTTVPQSYQLLCRIAEEFGFQNFTYLAGKAVTINGIKQFDPHNPPICITNFPEEWSRLYVEKAYYKLDPAIQHLMSNILPATWEDFAATGQLDPGQREVLGTASEFGLRQGFTVPIHGPAGEFGLLSLTSGDQAPEFQQRIQRSRHALHLLGIHLHNTLYQLVRSPEPATAVHLTQREVEVLRWTAEGKTSWEISGILNLSERTVNFHIDSAKKKLGVFSKTHAVAKMYSLGIAKIF